MQNVLIDPYVAFSIMDDYIRRAAERLIEKHTVRNNEEAGQAPAEQTKKHDRKHDRFAANFHGGVLLGAQIKNTFLVRSFCPSIEREAYVAVQKLTPAEKFLGWYTAAEFTGADVFEVSRHLQSDSPLIVTFLPPSEDNPSVRFRAFIVCSLMLRDQTGVPMKALQELECSIDTSSDIQASVVLDTVASNLFPELASASDPARPSFNSSDAASDRHTYTELRSIKKNLLTARAYVEEVTTGKREGNKQVGRGLAEVIVTNKVSTVSPKVMTEKVQDVMMIQYISKIAAIQAQLVAAASLLQGPDKIKGQTLATAGAVLDNNEPDAEEEAAPHL